MKSSVLYCSFLTKKVLRLYATLCYTVKKFMAHFEYAKNVL